MTDMKSVIQPGKSMSSNNSVKSKKSSKDREKRKSSSSLSENNLNDKGSPSKDSKQYAGISSDSIFTYAEEFTYEHLSKEVCNTLTEDINYKLRYIIHDALLKARLSGRNVINSRDIDETFSNLSIEKVYGLPSNPSWVPFGDQNLLYLDDAKINLIELAEDQSTHAQYGSIVFTKKWYPDAEQSETSQALKNYFVTLCHAIISNDDELRRMALKDISENPRIGPIIEWFYHFGYFLLMKDITYDCLTLCALDLIETLENSPISSSNVSVKQLKLLVRLLLQRLLISVTSKDVLKPMCSTLAILCLREPLKDMVIAKINQKLSTVKYDVALPILSTIYFLGFDAVKAIFLSNINYFLGAVDDNQPEILNFVLGIYGTICKEDPKNGYAHSLFHETFGNRMVIFWGPLHCKTEESEKIELNFVTMKTQLIRTRRRVDCNIHKKHPRIMLEEVFEVPTSDCKVRRRIDEHRRGLRNFKKETHVTVGKTSLLLSVLKGSSKNKSLNKCSDHSLLTYNL